MIDLEFIERLIKVVDESGLDSLEIERGGTRVKLAKTPPLGVTSVGFAPQGVAMPQQAQATQAPRETTPAAADPKAPATSSDLLDITSPMVGTFYMSPAPDAPSYVESGSKVKPGDTLCIIEAMKLMNELESEVSGTIREICVDNGQPVEFGQVLFRVAPA
jgi:acetyl-CoA carboxylase biotin carboxyl carrier protein